MIARHPVRLKIVARVWGLWEVSEMDTMRREMIWAGGLFVCVLAVVIGAFAIIVLVPGDPAQNMLGYNATPESLANLREDLGLDRSVPEQFVDFVSGAVVGDFGESILKKEPVRTVIVDRARISAVLLLYSVVIAMAFAVPSCSRSCCGPSRRLSRTTNSSRQFFRFCSSTSAPA